MSLEVELGTGSATAESYISVADASTYHSNRGNTAWASLSTDATREQCLRKATDYMRQVYRSRWQGCRVQENQSLDWPRFGVIVEGWAIASNIVPTEVKNACAELALRAATGDLLADQSQGVVSEAVGPISVAYDKDSPREVRYKAVEAMLAPYLNMGGNTIMTELARV